MYTRPPLKYKPRTGVGLEYPGACSTAIEVERTRLDIDSAGVVERDTEEGNIPPVPPVFSTVAPDSLVTEPPVPIAVNDSIDLDPQTCHRTGYPIPAIPGDIEHAAREGDAAGVVERAARRGLSWCCPPMVSASSRGNVGPVPAPVIVPPVPCKPPGIVNCPGPLMVPESMLRFCSR